MDDVTLTLLISIAILLVVSISVPLLARIQKNLILLVIPLNVLADSFVLFTGGASSLLHSGIARGVIVGLIVLTLLPRIKINKVSILVTIFIIYTGFLVFLSSDILRSLNSYVKVSLSLSLILISYATIIDWQAFKKLQISMFVGILMILINVFLAQIFHLGKQNYSEEALYLAGGDIYITYVFALALVMAPLSLSLFKRDRLRYGLLMLYSVIAVITLIIGRRGSILAVLIGYTTILLMGSWYLRARVFKVVLFGILALAILFPLYDHIFWPLFEIRLEQSSNVEEIARFIETQIVWREFTNAPPVQALFGTEFFNGSLDYFGDRPIHIDFNSILRGTGLIGLVIYISIFVAIIITFVTALKNVATNDIKLVLLKPTFWGILVAGFTLSISIFWANLTAFSTFCLLVGALVRMATNQEANSLVPSERVQLNRLPLSESSGNEVS